VALQMQCHRTMMKFSPTVPSLMTFKGPPITPHDPATSHVNLLVMPILHANVASTMPIAFANFQQQFHSTLPEWQKILFGSLQKSYHTKHLYTQLCSMTPIMIVSDASVQKSGQSRFVWVIAEEHTPLWCGMGLAPGPEEDIYSGRAEAFGLLAAISFLTNYISQFDPPIPPTTVDCFCNNLGVIATLTAMQETTISRPNDTTADDHDIYLEITATVTRCTNLALSYQYVPGHQDTKANRPLTTIQEYHNMECDQLAKQPHAQQQVPCLAILKWRQSECTC